METMIETGRKAKEASRILARLSASQKNEILNTAADNLEANAAIILEANELDLQKARENGMPEPLQDRLMLSEARIANIAKGLRDVANLEDPIGQVDHMVKRPNGLLIGKQRVPLGVVGVIYEARPNVTADVFALCFKSGNSVILKGGKDAFFSNEAIARILQQTVMDFGLPEGSIQLLTDNSREMSLEFMKCDQFVDVLIPRGGAGLIRTVVQNATVPVIETGTGNCHVYVDESADLDMACDIIINGKTQRTGVCNAVESLVVHSAIASELMPKLSRRLAEHEVLMHADQKLMGLIEQGNVLEATEEDYGTEYLDLEISIKQVDSIDEAIEHINRFNTGHSEAIVTRDYDSARKFLSEVDAATVYVNASTRFTDGAEFGLGAEIGISTQKLHARGPMGLEALTTTKYIIIGEGQIRP